VTTRCGLVWDSPQVFRRFIEDCGVACEQITPQLLAAPFFRVALSGLIIPAGFGNPAFSRLLPALRASSARIRRFVEEGGNLLVYSAGDNRPGLYDWLPFTVEYFQTHRTCRISMEDPEYASLITDYDSEAMFCDGYFPFHEGITLATSEGNPVMIKKDLGMGHILVTAIHEYPSRRFVQEFCGCARETLF
jgi:hypothetical protein